MTTADAQLVCFDGTYTSETRVGDFIHVEHVVVSAPGVSGTHTFTDGTVKGRFDWSGQLIADGPTHARIEGEGIIDNAGIRSFVLEKAGATLNADGTADLLWSATDPVFGPIGGIAHRKDVGTCGTVKDTTPPVIVSVTPSVSSLWPPNHRMVKVTFATVATDDVSIPLCSISSITSNEPVEGLEGADTSPDWTFSGLVAELRAERSGSGSGRIYSIRVTCADEAANASWKNATVTVPHDNRR